MTRRASVLGAVAVALALVAGQAPRVQAETPSSPLDPTLRTNLLADAASLPRLRSLLVAVGGDLVEEHYYHGWSDARPANLKSASKSILSLLVGIAIDRGVLPGVGASIASFFPDHLTGESDPLRRTITIEDLLTMQAGLETTSNRNYGRFVQSRDWVRHVLTRPLVDRPGGRRIYSTGNTHLLSAILTRASGLTTLELARRYLGDPLGIDIPRWMTDPQGIYFGGNEMLLRPRDLVAIGQVLLDAGRFQGQRVVSADWVRASWVARSRSERSGREYGYGWWIRDLAGFRTYYAWGYGGQFLFVVPELELVVVMTSSPSPGPGRRQHLRALYELVECTIIPAVQDPGSV